MKNYFFIGLIICLSISCKERTPVTPPEVIERIEIDTLDLTNTTFDRRFGVWDMKFDSKDRLWIGTTNGLLMYDSQTKAWKTFDKSTFPPPQGYLTDSQVYYIEIDKSDNVYVRVGQVNNQLYIFNGTAWRVDTLQGSIYRFKMDNKNNTLWIGTSKGLVSVKNGVKTLYDKNNSILIPKPTSNEVYYDILGMDTEPNGTLWFGADADLIKFDGINWQRFKNADLPNKGWIVKTVKIDNNGLIFIDGYEVIYTFNGEKVIQDLTATFKKYDDWRISDFYFNPFSNNVFFQRPYDILYQNRDNQTFKVISSGNSKLPQVSSTPCIAFDSKGNAWIAKSSFIGKLPSNFR
jgi:hypothetical protein